MIADDFIHDITCTKKEFGDITIKKVFKQLSLLIL
jgi:hypothetical protein